MELSDLSPAQLQKLADRAQRELDRRQTRKPIAAVRLQLLQAANEAGYALEEVFPELHGIAQATAPAAGPRSRAAGDGIPALPVPDAAPARAPAPAPAPAAVDPLHAVVRGAARCAANRRGMPIPLAQVRSAADLEADWPAFHAALEQAVRRGWLHFSGNDACILTPDGEAAAG